MPWPSLGFPSSLPTQEKRCIIKSGSSIQWNSNSRVLGSLAAEDACRGHGPTMSGRAAGRGCRRKLVPLEQHRESFSSVPCCKSATHHLFLTNTGTGWWYSRCSAGEHHDAEPLTESDTHSEYMKHTVIAYGLFGSLWPSHMFPKLQVCQGEATVAKIMAWVKNKYAGKLRLKVSTA